MAKKEIIIGTRGSELALWQANWVKAKLEQHYPEMLVQLRIIQTTGDRILNASLSQIGDKGLFTKEIELQLLKGYIDLAVHSFKDLPTERPEGLHIAALCNRQYPADALVSKGKLTLAKLPPGAVIFTSSLRRQAQLLHFRRDFQIEPIRGNIHTRLRKFDDSNGQAMVLAEAGLRRLGLHDRITERLDPEKFLPACGQGILAVEIRVDDPDMAELVELLDDVQGRLVTMAERTVLAELRGGCQVPIGAYGKIVGDRLHLRGMLSDVEGKNMKNAYGTAPIDQALELGTHVARQLLARGGRWILAQILPQTDDVQNQLFD